LAATYARLGQLERARDEATEALRIEPWFTINQGIFARLCKRPEDAEHFSNGLRKAGFSGVMTRLPGEPIVHAPIMRRTTYLSATGPRGNDCFAAADRERSGRQSKRRT
jgi:hypothetical protein